MKPCRFVARVLIDFVTSVTASVASTVLRTAQSLQQCKDAYDAKNSVMTVTS